MENRERMEKKDIKVHIPMNKLAAAVGMHCLVVASASWLLNSAFKFLYSHPPLNDTVKSLNSNLNSEQYAFPIKTT